MTKENWYRNQNWSDEEKEHFYQKLSRARDNYLKSQYMSIKARALYEGENQAHIMDAMILLQDALKIDSAEKNMIYYQLAECYSILGNKKLAAENFKKSVKLEEKDSVRTDASKSFAIFIIENEISKNYNLAIDLMQTRVETFPVVLPDDKFVLHAIKAIVLDKRHKVAEAEFEASEASYLLDINSASANPLVGIDHKKRSFLISRVKKILHSN